MNEIIQGIATIVAGLLMGIAIVSFYLACFKDEDREANYRLGIASALIQICLLLTKIYFKLNT